MPFACALFVSENRFNNCDPILSQENLGPRSSDIAYEKPTIGNKKNYPKSRNATEPAFLKHSSRHANPYPRPLCILSPYSKGQVLTAEFRPSLPSLTAFSVVLDHPPDDITCTYNGCYYLCCQPHRRYVRIRRSSFCLSGFAEVMDDYHRYVTLASCSSFSCS